MTGGRRIVTAQRMEHASGWIDWETTLRLLLQANGLAYLIADNGLTKIVKPGKNWRSS